jgi:predicted nucleic acid-binding protein
MPVVFDTSFLIAILESGIARQKPPDPRVEYLVRSLETSRTRVIVPTPALCEVLIGAGDAAPRYLDILTRSSRFAIMPFGIRAAVEAAAAHREAIQAGDKREGAASWVKVKYDRQIVAIAKVTNADVIYSNDGDIKRFSVREGMTVVTIAELPHPPEEPQRQLQLDPIPDGETTPDEP